MPLIIKENSHRSFQYTQYFSDKIKRKFFQVVARSEILYHCTAWTSAKRLKKKTRWDLRKNATCCFKQIMEAAHHKTAAVWPPNPILKTIRGRWTTHAWYYWKSKHEVISNVILKIPTDVHSSVAIQVKPTFISSLPTLDADQRTCQERWSIRTIC